MRLYLLHFFVFVVCVRVLVRVRARARACVCVCVGFKASLPQKILENLFLLQVFSIHVFVTFRC